MRVLEKDWFSTGTIDLEYKQYVLLDYIQGVEGLFFQNKLYPSMSDLKSIHKELVRYKSEKDLLMESFPKKITGFNTSSNEIIYESTFKNEISELDIIDDIVNYSIPLLKDTLNKGKEIYSFFEDMIEFIPVGLDVPNKNEGYIMVRINREVIVYRYNANFFNTKRRDLKLTEVDKFMSSLSNNVDKIKKKLIKKYDLPAPATFFVDIEIDLPLEETILPIIRRKFVSEFIFD